MDNRNFLMVFYLIVNDNNRNQKKKIKVKELKKDSRVTESERGVREKAGIIEGACKKHYDKPQIVLVQPAIGSNSIARRILAVADRHVWHPEPGFQTVDGLKYRLFKHLFGAVWGAV
ncbi:MAG: hypothetical protein ACNA78_11990, partial [Balneolaceae bacterium]